MRRPGQCLLALVSISGLLASAGVVADPDAVSSYLDAWNGRLARLDNTLSDKFVDQTTLPPLDGNGFRAQLGAWRTLIPNLHVSLLERTQSPGHELLRLRYSGRPADAGALIPVSGGIIAIEQTESLEVEQGRIVSRRAIIDDWTVPTELLFVPPPAVPFEPVATRTVAQFGAGKFLESIAFSPDGTAFVSTGPDGAIVTLDAAGAPKPFAALDVGPGGFMMCLAFDDRGSLYASVLSRNPSVHGVWRFTSTGQPTRLAQLPLGSAPNGIAFDGRSSLLVADSFGGVIWRVPTSSGPAQVWLRHPWLARRPLIGRFPGANGLQRAGQTMVVSSSDRSLLLRVALQPDGSAGAVTVLASDLPADDLAIAPDQTLYVTTHPFNMIVRLTADGHRAVIAGPAQGIIGPSAAAFAPDGSLYVTQDGGLSRPLPGVTPVAAVMRLQVGGVER